MSNFFHVSDEFWNAVSPLLIRRERNPKKKYKRQNGGGRKPLNYRPVLEGIIYVLKTGCQWKALPKEFGSSSAVHRYFRYWESSGTFHKMWETGLAVYDDMKGIAWKWQALDGSHTKAPIANEAVGKSPVDRGEKWNKKTFIGGRKWYPVIAIDNRRK